MTKTVSTLLMVMFSGAFHPATSDQGQTVPMKSFPNTGAITARPIGRTFFRKLFALPPLEEDDGMAALRVMDPRIGVAGLGEPGSPLSHSYT